MRVAKRSILRLQRIPRTDTICSIFDFPVQRQQYPVLFSMNLEGRNGHTAERFRAASLSLIYLAFGYFAIQRPLTKGKGLFFQF